MDKDIKMHIAIAKLLNQEGEDCLIFDSDFPCPEENCPKCPYRNGKFKKTGE
jgi:hypothetical protein